MAQGTTVRILVGPQRGKRGEIVRIDGRHYSVSTSAGTATFLASELAAI